MDSLEKLDLARCRGAGAKAINSLVALLVELLAARCGPVGLSQVIKSPGWESTVTVDMSKNAETVALLGSCKVLTSDMRKQLFVVSCCSMNHSPRSVYVLATQSEYFKPG